MTRKRGSQLLPVGVEAPWTDCPIFKVIDSYVCTIKYPDFKMLATNIKFNGKCSISLQLWAYLPEGQ